MLICVLAATGIFCWPLSPTGIRTRAQVPLVPASWRSTTGYRGPAITGNVLVAAFVYAADGVVVGVCAALLSVTVTSLARSEWGHRRDHREMAGLLVATRTLARELRSGAAPATAIAASAAAHPGMPARVLEVLIAGSGGDGPLHSAAGRRAGRTLAVEMTERLALGQSLSGRYGVPWAALVETVSVDLADRLQAKSDRSAQVAGPRVSGYVLAAMPGLGLLLGIGMGADPLHVLLNTGAGHLMMLIGCSLTCAGLVWSARIIR